MKNKVYVLCLSLILSGCAGSDVKEEETKEPESKEVAEVTSVVQTAPSVAHYNQAPATKHEDGPIAKAMAIVNAKSDSEIVGAVTFTVVNNGLRVVADVGGLEPGKHGFHVHEHGDCSAHDGSSAGGHFNPHNTKHGGPESEVRHAGDLGNLEANEYGFAHYDRVFPDLYLNGKYSIIGKSIVIHAGEDDLVSNPSGNSGKRIGCGPILNGEL